MDKNLLQIAEGGTVGLALGVARGARETEPSHRDLWATPNQ